MPTNTTIQPKAFPPGYRAQSGRFLSVSIGGVVIGGLQDYSYTETFGTHWVPEVGSDHLEPEFGAPQVNGTARRLVLNMRKFRDLIAGGDASEDSIDFRNFQFTLVNAYQEAYIAAPFNNVNSTVPGSATSAGPIQEVVNNVMFSDITYTQNDAVSLARENVTFIGTSIGADRNSRTAGP